jgi:antitoxin YefM
VKGEALIVLTYSNACANLKDVMDHVVENHTPVTVTRDEAPSVVIVSLADWTAMEETARLLSSPKNAERLAGAITELNIGPQGEA